MARTVYIIAFAQQAGRSTAALGLMELLSARGMVAATGQPVFVADCRNDSRFAARIAANTGYVPVTMLIVPLGRGDETPAS